MKNLNYENSKKCLEKLFLKLNIDSKPIDEYLNSQPVNLIITQQDFHLLPTLWCSESMNNWFNSQIFEDVILFNNNTKNESFGAADVVYQMIVPKLTSFLEQQKLESILTINDKKHRILEFATKESNKVIGNYHSIDAYFFPKDLSWLFCITHEDFSFLVSSKKFISDFKNFFPKYNKYIIKDKP